MSKYLKKFFFQVKRFNNEVSSDVTALTGMQFFSITRKLMLSVVAKVITYEIFLLQMQQGKSSEPEVEHNFCEP